MKFSGGLFEFTSDLAIFDLLDVPARARLARRRRERSRDGGGIGFPVYNECIQEVVQLRTNELEGSREKLQLRADAVGVSAFLSRRGPRSKTQLTYAGLAEIHSTLRENEVGVLYRNLFRDGV